ncbi:hypothetical protein GJAV_G00270900 [Gymnothorax javanicus]|nr:hypothetical protein GJAV_G00270900 [Gymnothorax javanicus]
MYQTGPGCPAVAIIREEKSFAKLFGNTILTRFDRACCGYFCLSAYQSCFSLKPQGGEVQQSSPASLQGKLGQTDLGCLCLQQRLRASSSCRPRLRGVFRLSGREREPHVLVCVALAALLAVSAAAARCEGGGPSIACGPHPLPLRSSQLNVVFRTKPRSLSPKRGPWRGPTLKTSVMKPHRTLLKAETGPRVGFCTANVADEMGKFLSPSAEKILIHFTIDCPDLRFWILPLRQHRRNLVIPTSP